MIRAIDRAYQEGRESKDEEVAALQEQLDETRDSRDDILAERDAAQAQVRVLMEAGKSYIESHKPRQNGALAIQVDPECYCKYCVPMRRAMAAKENHG